MLILAYPEQVKQLGMVGLVGWWGLEMKFQTLDSSEPEI